MMKKSLLFRKSFLLVVVLSVILTTTVSCGNAKNKSAQESDISDTTVIPQKVFASAYDGTPPVTAEKETEPITPVGNELSISGTVYPENGSNLSLHLEWTAKQNYDSQYASLTVKVFLDCYAISVGERPNCSLSVDGTVHKFISPKILNEHDISSSYELYNVSADIFNPYRAETAVKLSAEYNFGGTYSGIPVDIISLSDTITLSASGNYNNPLVPEFPPDAFTPN